MSYSPDEKANITAQLGACLAVQRTYGKQASDITTVSKIFFEDLKEFSGKDVAQAIAKWRKTSPEFPTPADIFAILDPTPKLDRATYISLNKRKSSLSDNSQEMRYIRAYERQELKKVETDWDRLDWEEKNRIRLKSAGIFDTTTNKPATPLQKEISPEEKAALLSEWNARNEQKPIFEVPADLVYAAGYKAFNGYVFTQVDADFYNNNYKKCKNFDEKFRLYNLIIQEKSFNKVNVTEV